MPTFASIVCGSNFGSGISAAREIETTNSARNAVVIELIRDIKLRLGLGRLADRFICRVWTDKPTRQRVGSGPVLPLPRAENKFSAAMQREPPRRHLTKCWHSRLGSPVLGGVGTI